MCHVLHSHTNIIILAHVQMLRYLLIEWWNFIIHTNMTFATETRPWWPNMLFGGDSTAWLRQRVFHDGVSRQPAAVFDHKILLGIKPMQVPHTWRRCRSPIHSSLRTGNARISVRRGSASGEDLRQARICIRRGSASGEDLHQARICIRTLPGNDFTTTQPALSCVVERTLAPLDLVFVPWTVDLMSDLQKRWPVCLLHSNDPATPEQQGRIESPAVHACNSGSSQHRQTWTFAYRWGGREGPLDPHTPLQPCKGHFFKSWKSAKDFVSDV